MSSLAVLLQKAKRRPVAELASLTFLRTRDRLVLAVYRARYPQVRFGVGVVIHGTLKIRGNGKVFIGDFVTVRGRLEIDVTGEIIIGPHSTFGCYRGQINILTARTPESRVVAGPYSLFNGAHVLANTVIEFGPHCIVSDALLEDTDYHSTQINRWDPDAPVKSFPIYISENVWIGSRAVVLKGVTIGRNSVIGLGAVVRKSVPENCIVIGNPQQIVKELDTAIAPYDPALQKMR